MDMSDCMEETHPLFVSKEDQTSKNKEYKKTPPEPPPFILNTYTHSPHHLNKTMLDVQTSDNTSTTMQKNNTFLKGEKSETSSNINKITTTQT